MCFFIHEQQTYCLQVQIYKVYRSNSILPPPLVLYNNVLQQVYMYRYLGVTLSSDLSGGHILQLYVRQLRSLLVLYTGVSQPTHHLGFVVQIVCSAPPGVCICSRSPYHKEKLRVKRVQTFALNVCLKAWQ